MKHWIPLGVFLLIALSGCSKDRASAGKFEGKTATTYEEALSMAKSQNMPVLLVVHQGDYELVERNLLNDASIKERSDKFITAKLDATSGSGSISQLNVRQYPALIVLKADGTEVWRNAQMPMPDQVAQALDGALGVAK